MKGYERSVTYCMKMGGLQKETACRLFEGMEITEEGDDIIVRYLTVVPMFQVNTLSSLQSPAGIIQDSPHPLQ